ncbi:MAG: sirohydrochlorin cobaltochelatase [Methanocella sp. PtaU1.Bin125]|nr:MAG: sirohydrochlorin cobaltochelatase [Methanocella sp. PtaU1.Bin125]
MRPDDAGRPGLLLVCHGDLPETLLEDPGCGRLYGECLSACGPVPGEAAAVQAKDELSRFSGRVASHVSAGADGPVELAFMGFRKPGIREAMYRVLSAGARSIVCVGAGGLMLPGCIATVHLPAAVRQVIEINPGLDVFYAPPGTNPHLASSLVMASVENALNGPGIAPRPSGDMPRIRDETGVIVVSSLDQAAIFGACDRRSSDFAAAVKRLSDYCRGQSAVSGTGFGRFMTQVSACLRASGNFCGVEAGYLDFSGPVLDRAAQRLVQAGARTIIAAGMPTLMHRHTLSLSDPAEALKQLKNSCPADIVYVPPDSGAIEPEVGMMLRLKVLDALAKGACIEPSGLRGPSFA